MSSSNSDPTTTNPNHNNNNSNNVVEAVPLNDALDIEVGPAVIYNGLTDKLMDDDKLHPFGGIDEDIADSDERYGKVGGGVYADNDNDDPHHSNNNNHYLLESPSCMDKIPLIRVVRRIIPHGGFLANVYNLASATLGAGIVTVSSGFHNSGIVVSTVLLIAVCILTIYSIYLLVVTQEKTKFRSYEEMARGLLGIGWDYFAAFMMFMFCWGTCVGYVGSVQDLLKPLLNDPQYPSNEFLRSTTGHRLLTALVWLVGMFSLSLPKQINTLRYASIVGVMFIVYFVICIIIHSAMNGLTRPIDEPGNRVNLATSGMNAVNGLTLFIYAFICQVNVFEIYEEMSPKTKSPRTMTRDAAISMSCVALLNFLAGLFGYMDFREGMTGSLLLQYEPHRGYLFVAYIGLCIKLCVGFAICIQPSRDAIYYVLGLGKTSDVPFWFNWIVSGALAVLALVCAFFIPDISIVFNLLGGICGCFLAFLFPAYFYVYSGDFTWKKKGWGHFVGIFLLCVAGVVSLVFGTAATVFEMVKEYS